MCVCKAPDGSEAVSEEFALVHELESELGIAFGAHQNAYTSFDETVYFLHVPLSSEGDHPSSDAFSAAQDGDGGDSISSGEGESGGGEGGKDAAGTAPPSEQLEQLSEQLGGGLGLLEKCVTALARLTLEARLSDQDVQAEKVRPGNWGERKIKGGGGARFLARKGGLIRAGE